MAHSIRRWVGSISWMIVVVVTGCGGDGGAGGAGASSPSGGGAAASTGVKGFVCPGKPEVGKPAPPFELDSATEGGKVSLAPGKVTLVDFWATWCGPCEKSFPKYQQLYVKYHASGFEIAALALDDKDTKKNIPGWVKARGAKFPVAWDEGHQIADCYKLPGMPSAFLVDKKGNVALIHEGFRDGDEKELEKRIKELL